MWTRQLPFSHIVRWAKLFPPDTKIEPISLASTQADQDNKDRRNHFYEKCSLLGWSLDVGKAELSHKRLEDVRGVIGELYGHELHAKRADSLAAASGGGMAGGSLARGGGGRGLRPRRGPGVQA